MSKIIGDFGEEFVSKYIEKKGFEILKRNFHSQFGEIDIIVKNSEYIVFIEVKTRKQNSCISGLEAIDIRKQKKIIKTAMIYLSKNDIELQPRFDVAEITFTKQNDRNLVSCINYIENAFSWRDEYDETF